MTSSLLVYFFLQIKKLKRKKMNRKLLLHTGLVIVAIFGIRIFQRQKLLKRQKLAKSSIDNDYYWVINGKAAADLLAETRQKMYQLIHSLPESNGDIEIDSLVRRLKHLFPFPSFIQVMELDSKEEDGLAFTWNKTDGFFFCLEDEISKTQLGRGDIILFLAIHELTHSAMLPFEIKSHSSNFKKMEKYLYDQAKRVGFLDPNRIPKTSLSQNSCRSSYFRIKIFFILFFATTFQNHHYSER